MGDRIKTKNLRQQVNTEKRRRNIIFFTLIILAFIYLSVTLLIGDMGLPKYLHLQKNKKKIEAEIKIMEKENKALKTEVEALKKDPYYIEKSAREEFWLAKPDELIFQFQKNDK